MRFEDGGRTTALGGPVPQAVLAILLCADGEPVPVDRLLREVWPAPDGRPGRKTLAAHVSRLRRALTASAPIEHLTSGYRIDPSVRTDAHQFVDLLAAAEERRVHHDVSGAHTCLVEALALWRGEPYAGVDAETVVAERARLTELALVAREDLAELQLALGDPVRVLEGLAGAASADPPRERALAAYATALHRTGRRTEALDAVREGQRALRAVGAVPRQLGELEQALLRDEVPARPTGLGTVTTATPPAEPPAPSRRAPEGRLANVPLSSFVGREELLAVVPQRLDRTRWLTLVGPAGVGKTRLALELLRRSALHESGLVRLAPLSDGGLVGTLVGEALGVTDSSATDLVEAAAAAVGDRPFLLVVDNCEHVREAVVPVVTDLLSALPALQVLTTSREALGSTGEHVIDVPVLPVVAPRGRGLPGPAVELFLDRLAEHSGWSPDAEDLDAVHRICAELDGLPLALELAAARCRALSPQDVADALGDRFGLLHAAGPAATPHHVSLRAAVAWSYELLEEREKEDFRALTVFEGGFELDAARALLGADAPAAVSDLVAKSLLTVDWDSRPRRYGTLVSLREYAASVTPAAEREGLRRRHLAWAVPFAGDAARGLTQGDAAGWVERLERERANLRAAVAAAVELGEVDAALALVADLGYFWYRSWHTDEGVAMLSLALSGAGGSSVRRARALVALSHLHHWRGQLEEAVATAVRASELAEDLGHLELLAEALVAQGWASALLGDLAEAEASARRALTAAEAAGSATQVCDALVNLGGVRHMADDWSGAEPFLRRAVALSTAAGHAWGVATGTWHLAKSALRGGHPRAAIEHAADLAADAAADGNRVLLLLSGLVVAASLAELDHPEQAADVLDMVERLCARTGTRLDLVDPHDTSWLTHRARGAQASGGNGAERPAASWSTSLLAQAIAAVRDDLPSV
jgi:predicted ATPase/DNA-binding SARP family transcriptional activator